ncbi:MULTISPECIES: energy-coupled thiamine transporter ThiT [unclassified Fictibacillus]|uniref:energy-coupled thiamine transporter ThiT n=1 Tax=unclassified Fictibacillus TaxID=2644029 RepID=UPI0008E85F7B|nr:MULTISPECIES: energy-coupled thiamine transporter ThiT [unclassified Fictibacillus]MED2973370.1 energy-coupled thiamine transporter ThiT [Fictibacillus sp. B-59209]UZJ77206.1 energy-coupled thiamine transporter ThiT [Fictibacillus sp. KU28468]SFD86712.1 thiamine transporter [Bacillus sp. OV194]
MSKKIMFLTEVAMMSALAIILSFVQFKGLWANGGSVSLEMLPIFLMAFRRGVPGGVLTGLIVGMVKILVDGTAGYNPAGLILDYPLAFLLAGFAGVFKVSSASQSKRRISAIVAGIAFGSLLRLASHVVSGVIFFASYAPKGMNPVLYSIVYNASYMIPVALITAAAFIFLTKTAPRLLHRTDPRVVNAA